MNLKLRISVRVKCGDRGHRGYDVTLKTGSQSYWWIVVRRDIKEITESCIHCTVSRAGKRIPRSLSHTGEGSKTKKVVHADILYTKPATNCEENYVLLIKDETSSYEWLQACVNGNSDAPTSILSQ